MTAEIHPARPADAARIAEIQVLGWREGYRGILPDEYLSRLDPVKRTGVWEKFIREGPGELSVAWRGERIIGFCHLMPSRDPDGEGVAEIAAIYVDPGDWRRGAGRKLFDGAIGSAEEKGFRWLTLWVLAGNRRGREFYGAMGMVPDGAEKREERPGVLLEEVRDRMALKVGGDAGRMG